MSDDQNSWYSDANSEPEPPPAPEPQQYPQPQQPDPRQPYSQQSQPQQPHPQQPHPQQPYPQQPYPQQPPTGYQPYGQPAYGPVSQSNGKATASMVIGIVGLVSIFLCYGVLGIVLGPISYFMGRSAEKEMNLAPNAWSNKGMARAGWIMGLIQIIIAIVAIIAIGAFIIWAVSTDGSDF